MSRKQVFRITLNSGDKTSGDNQNANYYVKLPYVIKRGQLILEKFTLTNAGTAFNGKTSIRIVSPSFPDPYTYNTSNKYHVLADIALTDDRFTLGNGAGSKFVYSRTASLEDVGYGLINYNFDNQHINIQLVDQADTAYTTAQITDYQITFVIVDHDPKIDEL